MFLINSKLFSLYSPKQTFPYPPRTCLNMKIIPHLLLKWTNQVNISSKYIFFFRASKQRDISAHHGLLISIWEEPSQNQHNRLAVQCILVTTCKAHMKHRSSPSQALSCSPLLIEGGSCSVVRMHPTHFFLAHLRHPNGIGRNGGRSSLKINSLVDYERFGVVFLAGTFGKLQGLISEAFAGDAP